MNIRTIAILLMVALSVTSFAQDWDSSINKTIRVESNQSSSESLESVNGSILVGKNCNIRGECETVNGKIRIGDGSKVQELSTVNGTIDIGRKVDVDGLVSSVNGTIYASDGSKINGNLETVNGKIQIENTTVKNDIETVNGKIEVLEKSLVQGSIIVKRNRGSWFKKRRKLTIYVEDGSTIDGDIIVEDDNTIVKLYLTGGSKVNGKIDDRVTIHKK